MRRSPTGTSRARQRVGPTTSPGRARTPEELPGAGEHKREDAALEVLQQTLGAWDEFKLSSDEFLEQGDTVVVLGHTELRKGDQSAQTPVVHVWRYRGDQPCRLQILTDTLQGARLLGIV